MGDRNEYKDDRDREVRAAFRRVLHLHGGFMSVREMYEAVSLTPTSRFFVSAQRAMRVVGRMDVGDPTRRMRPSNKRMYQEIHRRVKNLMSARPGLTLREAVEEVVEQPAPETYMGVRQIAHVCATRPRRL